MLSHVRLRRILKGHRSGTQRLDWILARNPDFLEPIKKEPQDDEEEKGAEVKDVFHRAIGPIVIVAQCFAIMPVVGMMRPNPKDVRFTMRCPQVMWTVVFFLAGMLFTIGIMKKLVKIGINAKNIVGVVFFVCVLFANMLFFSLARRWPKLIQYWSKVELVFLKKPYVIPKRNLAARVQRSAAVIILLSAVEHGLFFMSAGYSYSRQIKLCNSTQGPSFGHYMTNNYDYVFEVLPYSMEIGIAILIINGTFTFTWNYMDLFIMMVSKGIAYRFEQITVRIRNLSDKVSKKELLVSPSLSSSFATPSEIPESVFTEIREHYVQLCELLEYVDENLSGIILLSCMNNLYFVCVQLLNIFNKLRWPINYIYFWYSLLYLIGRTAFVFLTAASINDESKAPVSVLRRVSQKTWCIEVERLILQMTTQTVALSGKNFYYLTRKLLFGMAGTIVTYELVLLQFDEPNRAKGLPDLCS